MGKDGKVFIRDGVFVVIDPIESDTYATITPPTKGTIVINNVPVSQKTIVREDDVISFEPPSEKPERDIDVKISKDKMKAYINISYDPKLQITLKDCTETSDLTVRLMEKTVENHELFSASDIERFLAEKGIIFGLNKDVINEISSEQKVFNVLVAEGEEPKDAVDDSIEFLIEGKKEEDEEDCNKKINYRDRNTIVSVNEGEVFANIIRGKNSVNGKDIFGKEVRSKKNKILTITSGQGCRISENKVIAVQDGQVSYKKNQVSINKLYEVNGNVDISTGNINFQGDVRIEGNVTEGMLVCAKNNIHVSKSIYGCNVIALGDIKIGENVINSNISAGGEDVTKELRLKSVKKLEEVLKEVINNVEYISNNKVIGREINLGEVIKTLIDNKYKNFNRICTEVITNTLKDRDTNSFIVKFIHEKLVGLYILNIKSLDDLLHGMDLINEEINFLEQEKMKSANVEVEYCQESRVQASGDINIIGKGIISTEMYALGNIEFHNTSAVCRGGSLKAKKQIKASIVGSHAGVKTLLEVEDKDGRVIIDVAYNNTEIKIHNRRYVIENPSKQVNCYIDSHGELIVDKFVL